MTTESITIRLKTQLSFPSIFAALLVTSIDKIGNGPNIFQNDAASSKSRLLYLFVHVYCISYTIICLYQQTLLY